jgi:hypothetical protein
VNCRDLKQKPNIGLSFTVLGAAVTQWSSQPEPHIQLPTTQLFE